MLTPSNVAVKGSKGFKIHKPKGSTANDTSPLQNIIHRASIASSTAKPMYITEYRISDSLRLCLRTVSPKDHEGPCLPKDPVPKGTLSPQEP